MTRVRHPKFDPESQKNKARRRLKEFENARKENDSEKPKKYRDAEPNNCGGEEDSEKDD